MGVRRMSREPTIRIRDPVTWNGVIKSDEAEAEAEPR